jgi:hypothetical protein
MIGIGGRRGQIEPNFDFDGVNLSGGRMKKRRVRNRRRETVSARLAHEKGRVHEKRETIKSIY